MTTSYEAFNKLMVSHEFNTALQPYELTWQAAVQWALEEAAKKCEEVGNRAENYETSDAANSIRIMKEELK